MRVVIGIDEVGRGCWAGPLVAAAVVLEKTIIGLKDSKLLTREQRQHLATKIKQNAISYGLGWVYPKQIDALGLTAATRLAMKTAFNELLPLVITSRVIIDGNYNYLCQCQTKPCGEGFETLVKADRNIPAVSAASVLAKVARDEYMMKAAKKYPHYQFQKHVGYGTLLHREMLKLYGSCDIHRLSYKPVRAIKQSL